jgi:hypothetical protein
LATGLKVNFQKSCLVAINIDDIHATTLAQFFWMLSGKNAFYVFGASDGDNQADDPRSGTACWQRAEKIKRLLSLPKLWWKVNLC